MRDLHHGLINLRSDRTVLTIARMKEQRTGKTDIRDSCTLPREGRFRYERPEDPSD